jgi:two-component system, LuxR family, sensor kinase FixL
MFDLKKRRIEPPTAGAQEPPATSSLHSLRRAVLPISAAALALAVFLVDSFSSLGIAIAVLYGIVVLMSVSFCDRRGVLFVALGCAALTLISYGIEHATEEPGAPLLRCLMSLAALAVTTVLVLRNQTALLEIADRERRYRTIFQSTAVAIWEEDYSQVASALMEVRRRGVEDIGAYLAEHPEFVRRCMALVRTVDVNDAAVRLVDASSKEQLVSALPDVFIPESMPMLRGFLVALLDGRDSFESETQIQSFSGERRAVLVAATFSPGPHRYDRVFVSSVDITERSRAERALAQTRLALAHVSRVTTLGELTASIAHEVNQPLSAIVTNAEACLRWLDRIVPDLTEARRCVEEIAAQGRRAGDVVQRLRALSKNSEPQRAPADVNEIIGEAIGLVERELSEHRVSFRFDAGLSLSEVSVDRVQIQQVIINLLVNAMHAMETLERRELVVLSREAAPDSVEITVRDSGVGLEAVALSGLFTPFYTTKPQGMGMGLSISRSIVEAHGGRIWAEPNEGPGVTFHVALPAVRKAA